MSRIKDGISFLQWALPKMGYQWDGFSKPREQVLKRIRERMQELELQGGYSEYQSYLKNHPEEWKRLDRMCDVTVSRFFRDRKMWDFIRDELLASLLKQDKEHPLAIWSAGCCNGEEPYSIAIIYEQLKKSVQIRRSVEILASDRNPAVLERARQGKYPSATLKELSESEKENFFTEKDSPDEPFLVKDILRKPITFEQRDIRRSLPDQNFDMIFCRSLVFTYFDEQHQKKILNRLKPLLKDSGFLVIGAHESLPKNSWLDSFSKTHPIYQKTSS